MYQSELKEDLSHSDPTRLLHENKTSETLNHIEIEPLPLSFFEEYQEKIKHAEVKRTRYTKDETLVHGYIREHQSYFPLDLVNACFIWYHPQICGIFLAGDGIKINDDENIITHEGTESNSCYGSIIMPSRSLINTDYECKIKIINNSSAISIGIDDSKCEHIEYNFTGQPGTKNYAYHSLRGYQYNCRVALEYGDPFDTGDTIKMCFNPYNSTLEFWKNEVYQGCIGNIYRNDNLSYRLCIYMGDTAGTKVKLL